MLEDDDEEEEEEVLEEMVGVFTEISVVVHMVSEVCGEGGLKMWRRC